jgi:hypothetical protein
MGWDPLMRYVVIFLVSVVCGYLFADAIAHASPTLSICSFNHSGQCAGGAGWQFQTSDADQCGASLLWSQAYGYDVSVWIDDSAPNRDTLDQCEQSIDRASYHVFVGNYSNSEPRLSYGENMMEWYPFHYSSTVSPATQNDGCPPTNGNQGFVAQDLFAWPNDTPPTASESGREWQDSIACIPAGQQEFMGAY